MFPHVKQKLLNTQIENTNNIVKTLSLETHRQICIIYTDDFRSFIIKHVIAANLFNTVKLF